MKPTISVIIPIWNSVPKLVEYTQKCVETVKKTTIPLELIVIDNDSPIKRDYDVDNQIRFEENKGIPHAWNAGIKIAKGEYICHINNDVFLPKGWAEKLLEIKREVKATFISPICTQSGLKEKLDGTCEGYDGACFLTEKSTYDKLGLFDESFGLYFYEDTDMYERAKKAGMTWVRAMDCVAKHIGRASCNAHPDSEKMLQKTGINFRKKWGKQ